MVQVLYDGSFEGLLTAIFEVYEYKFPDVHITGKKVYNSNIYQQQHVSFTAREKAGRVWKGLRAISPYTADCVYKTFLSELPDIESILLQYIRYVFSGRKGAEKNIGNPLVLKVTQIVKKINREKHRMEAFVRFQLTRDELYYAIVEPDFNVLPLIAPHFESRYADQRWLIYDGRRKFGIHYDGNNVSYIELHFSEELNQGKNIALILDDSEAVFQQLWKQYFGSVNIAARKNTRLHIRHMPKRYWKYLPEKQ